MGEGGRLVGAVAGRLDIAIDIGVAALQPPLQKVEAAENHREHIVEVVGDPAGQLTDRFHLLGLAQLLLGLHQGGGALFHRLFQVFARARQNLARVDDLLNVRAGAEPAGDRALIVANRLGAAKHPSILAGSVTQPIFDVIGLAGL